MTQYTDRIGKFTPCEIAGFDGNVAERREIGERLWLCDRGRGARTLSSEDVAVELSKVLSSGARDLQIVVGGPDGFSDEDRARWRPDLRWCYGPMTLPHELAAVVAGEQVYRAWSILRNLPYHGGHL